MHHKCSELGNCEYTMFYTGAAPSSGSLSMESFIFGTSDDGLVTVPDVVFGCSHQSHEHPDLVMGVVGLSAKMPSFATQFGGKFSYCVGNIKDHAYEYNQLSFGDAAIFNGDVTPLVVDPSNGFYFLDLEGISLGGTMVNLPTGTFRKRDSWHGGVMIDSGSEDTYLPVEVYYILAEDVRKTVSQLRSQFRGRYGIRRLCFEGNMSTDTEGFPILRFHFPGGAELAMEAESLFIQTETALFCMTLATKSEPLFQHFILGINAQQYNNIGIDPSAKKLYIQRIECDLLLH
ncbi:hypothetical protein MLD38_007195 [Melastoma candidum]|nr:hypothetical protein MLD38_007195 [Melastoma candidum]